jgi:hypothetical protein
VPVLKAVLSAATQVEVGLSSLRATHPTMTGVELRPLVPRRANLLA